MKYYVYFDAYGHPRRVIDEKRLVSSYDNDPQKFLRDMSACQPDADGVRITGHVGTLSFDSEQQLKQYLAALGDEISGFYDCLDDSRPYNF